MPKGTELTVDCISSCATWTLRDLPVSGEEVGDGIIGVGVCFGKVFPNVNDDWRTVLFGVFVGRMQGNSDAFVAVVANCDDEFFSFKVNGSVNQGHLWLLTNRDELVRRIDEHPSPVKGQALSSEFGGW